MVIKKFRHIAVTQKIKILDRERFTRWLVGAKGVKTQRAHPTFAPFVPCLCTLCVQLSPPFHKGGEGWGVPTTSDMKGMSGYMNHVNTTNIHPCTLKPFHHHTLVPFHPCILMPFQHHAFVPFHHCALSTLCPYNLPLHPAFVPLVSSITFTAEQRGPTTSDMKGGWGGLKCLRYPHHL